MLQQRRQRRLRYFRTIGGVNVGFSKRVGSTPSKKSFWMLWVRREDYEFIRSILFEIFGDDALEWAETDLYYKLVTHFTNWKEVDAALRKYRPVEQ